MPVARRLATGFLDAAVRYSSPDSKEWSNAMLRELDFVEGNWTAFCWALGSVTALCRHSVPLQVREWLERHYGSTREIVVENIRKTVIAVLSGIVVAGGMLAICVGGLLYLMSVLLPERSGGGSLPARPPRRATLSDGQVAAHFGRIAPCGGVVRGAYAGDSGSRVRAGREAP